MQNFSLCLVNAVLYPKKYHYQIFVKQVANILMRFFCKNILTQKYRLVPEKIILYNFEDSLEISKFIYQRQN